MATYAAADGNDTRTFARPRQPSARGYSKLPCIDDSLGFVLPPFRRYAGRIVQIESQIWELWSPNLHKERPFLPGLKKPSLQLNILPSEPEPRCDGHLGRFDFTVSPQYFDPERPWRAFIRRASSVPPNSEDYPEFAFIYEVWRSDPKPATVTGRIDPRYINALRNRYSGIEAGIKFIADLETSHPGFWGTRPRFPEINDFDRLASITTYDAAIDLCAWLQRGLKDRAAWSVMGDRIRNNGDKHYARTRLESFERADPMFMGVWINGAEELDVLWFLRVKVPCFIVHEITQKERVHLPAVAFHKSFITGTPIEFVTSKAYPYDVIARRNGTIPAGKDFSSGIAASPPPLVERDRARSFSRNQGWTQTLGVVLELPDVRPPAPREGPLPTSSADTIPPVPPPSSNPYIAPVVIHPDHFPWIPPPAVQPVTPNGKWSDWLMSDSGRYCSQTKIDDEDYYVYFDRINLRRIHSSTRAKEPQGYISDWHIFGLPAFDAQYEDQREKVVQPSLWMYTSRDPPKGTLGRLAPRPQPSELPRRTAEPLPSRAPVSSAPARGAESNYAVSLGSPIHDPGPPTQAPKMSSPTPPGSPLDSTLMGSVPAPTSTFSISHVPPSVKWTGFIAFIQEKAITAGGCDVEMIVMIPSRDQRRFWVRCATLGDALQLRGHLSEVPISRTDRLQCTSVDAVEFNAVVARTNARVWRNIRPIDSPAYRRPSPSPPPKPDRRRSTSRSPSRRSFGSSRRDRRRSRSSERIPPPRRSPQRDSRETRRSRSPVRSSKSLGKRPHRGRGSRDYSSSRSRSVSSSSRRSGAPARRLSYHSTPYHSESSRSRRPRSRSPHYQSRYDRSPDPRSRMPPPPPSHTTLANRLRDPLANRLSSAPPAAGPDLFRRLDVPLSDRVGTEAPAKKRTRGRRAGVLHYKDLPFPPPSYSSQRMVPPGSSSSRQARSTGGHQSATAESSRAGSSNQHRRRYSPRHRSPEDTMETDNDVVDDNEDLYD